MPKARRVFCGLACRGKNFSRGPSLIFDTGFTILTGNPEVNGRVRSHIPSVDHDHGTTRDVLSFSLQNIMPAHWSCEKCTYNTLCEGWVHCVCFDNELWVAESNRNVVFESGKAMANYQGEILVRPGGGLHLPPSMIFGARKCVRAANEWRKLRNQKVECHGRQGNKAEVRVFSLGLRPPTDPARENGGGDVVYTGPSVRNLRETGRDLSVRARNDPEFPVFLSQSEFIMSPEIRAGAGKF